MSLRRSLPLLAAAFLALSPIALRADQSIVVRPQNGRFTARIAKSLLNNEVKVSTLDDAGKATLVETLHKGGNTFNFDRQTGALLFEVKGTIVSLDLAFINSKDGESDATITFRSKAKPKVTGNGNYHLDADEFDKKNPNKPFMVLGL